MSETRSSSSAKPDPSQGGHAGFHRLCAAYGVHGPVELARAMKLSKSTVQNWVERGPSAGALRQTHLETGRSLEWLAFGDEMPASLMRDLQQHMKAAKSQSESSDSPAGAREQSENSESARYPVEPSVSLTASEPPPREWAAIRRLSAKASAGPGHENHHVEPVADVAFNPAWLRARFGRSPEHLALIEVTGHSMEPTFFEGDTIMVDTQQRDIDGGGLFVLRLGPELLVKRVQRLISGGLQIISDNPAFKSELLEPGFERQLEITGRVIWPRSR